MRDSDRSAEGGKTAKTGLTVGESAGRQASPEPTPTTHTGDELAPCPFCGGEPTNQRYQDYDNGRCEEGWQVSTIGCPNCEVEFTYWTEAEAITAWNTRTTQADNVLRSKVGHAMQEAWNDICGDTGCHPLDIKHGRGKVLFYSPGHWADLTALYLDAALKAPTTEPNPEGMKVAERWQPYHGGTALSFEPGVFNLNRSGSASLAFRESVIEWETDDESGATYLVANLPTGEAEAIRKWLNEWLPVPSTLTDTPEHDQEKG